MKPFEAQTCIDGIPEIRWKDGERLIVNSGEKGVGDFVDEYLADMNRLYPAHLKAVDAKLRGILGDQYNNVKANAYHYNICVAKRSLNCIFGIMDNVLDCDEAGEYNIEFVPCPDRDVCPFNGYNTAFADRELVICNPIIDLPLTRQERVITNLLVNRLDMDEVTISEVLCISQNTVHTHVQRIYTKLEVNSRIELIGKLGNKRIK